MMELPSEVFSGLTLPDKVITAPEAVALIRDGDTIVVEGFASQCFAEELTLALEDRFLKTGAPKTLPAYVPVDTFPVIIEDQTIKLEVE